jgi:hypothetical protein
MLSIITNGMYITGNVYSTNYIDVAKSKSACFAHFVQC